MQLRSMCTSNRIGLRRHFMRLGLTLLLLPMASG